MKLVKITSLGCSSCIIVNNTLDKILKNYDIEVINVDYDFDDYEYEVGKTLPVLIFLDDSKNEVSRLVGEVGYEKIENEIRKLMQFEKDFVYIFIFIFAFAFWGMCR